MKGPLTPVDVGSRGKMAVGPASGSKSVGMVMFTEGKAFTVLEFDSPPNDPVRRRRLDLARKQDAESRPVCLREPKNGRGRGAVRFGGLGRARVLVARIDRYPDPFAREQLMAEPQGEELLITRPDGRCRRAGRGPRAAGRFRHGYTTVVEWNFVWDERGQGLSCDRFRPARPRRFHAGIRRHRI